MIIVDADGDRLAQRRGDSMDRGASGSSISSWIAACLHRVRCLGRTRMRSAANSHAASTFLVRSVDGCWISVHGTVIGVGRTPRAAVIIEPAHPDRITPLLMAIHGLTPREREVTRLVLQGRSTTQIANRLGISPHTVQQHLKGIFEKGGRTESARARRGPVLRELRAPGPGQRSAGQSEEADPRRFATPGALRRIRLPGDRRRSPTRPDWLTARGDDGDGASTTTTVIREAAPWPC